MGITFLIKYLLRDQIASLQLTVSTSSSTVADEPARLYAWSE